AVDDVCAVGADGSLHATASRLSAKAGRRLVLVIRIVDFLYRRYCRFDDREYKAALTQCKP
ncbi:MAG: hypothetical protein Q8L38_07120, partial [Pseudohongiella sp.]|nr:hypothetical protein [Pseudohongiella sp.]